MTRYNHERLTSRYLIKKGQSASQTVLADGKYPASAAFVPITGYPLVHILIDLGTIADALTFKVQQASAINGTPSDVSGLTHTIAANDDGELVYFAFHTNLLATTSTHITVDVAGVSGSNYAVITYFLEGYSHPVTQTITTTEVVDLD